MKHLRRSWTISLFTLPFLSVMFVVLCLLGTQLAQAASWQVVASPDPGTFSSLNAVAVVSTGNVWAVGNTSGSITQTLIEHWNGTGWQVVASPNPGATDNSLQGVAAVSASNVWAVGVYQNGSNPSQTLVEHWNGKIWRVVASPNSGAGYNQLTAVVAVSASNIWAIGYARNSSNVSQTLIEHWNGTNWQIVSSPNMNNSFLYGVTQVNSANIWAVGDGTNSGGVSQTLIEHWNGTVWKIVASPNVGTVPNDLWDVAAVSASNIWAVGDAGTPSSPPTQTLIEHWNGKNWQVVASPNSGTGQNQLTGLTAISASNIWAVGNAANLNSASQTLIEHWNGTAWKVVPSPNVGTENNALNRVAAASSTSIWAVGAYAYMNTQLFTLTEEYS